jgi:hypothetical protein
VIGSRHILRVRARETAIRLSRFDLPLAIVLVESSLRPRWKRVVEYAVCAIFSFIGSSRAEDLTLGMAQVRLRTIRGFLAEEGHRWDWRMVVSVCERPGPAAAMAAWYLSMSDHDGPVSKHYTGRPNVYYESLVALVLEEFARVRRRVPSAGAEYGTRARRV